ncbi:Signal transduction histidine kinase [Flexibacter flexilis DSM 6793]|uniref:histidine kinase n=1 Tax=Flexibacter flexilis DSM 6793 TaxID=927664 RepID=A0A1I1DET9_9BACT|nr:HAMP domain-containing sensor histidine kinase [Flexibacter flexilis]SFB73431.1 Signal transduction histidine kinase [Flexibacter flexilis DSM 6793]
MKLLNKSIVFLSAALLIIISLWAVIFYFNMLSEIKESVDEGLENYKRQIIYKAQTDTTILSKNNFDESFFSVRGIAPTLAVRATDRYADTLIYMQDADDEVLELEPIRMLTTVFMRGDKYYELRIINSMVEEDDLIKELFKETIWLYLILITSIIIINNFLLKNIWKPFYSLLNQLKNYRLGKSQYLPTIQTNTKEFLDLENAVNTLLKHSIETYQQQKEFIGNASHELQTPLAIATNKLELFIEKGNLENSQAESIAEVMNIIQRLVRLNKSLLLLTKIENKQFFDNEKIDIAEIVWQNKSDLEEISEFKNVTISVQENSKFQVNMDVSLANIIVANLLRNAIFHNIQHGTVRVQIFDNTLCISNSGLGHSLDPTRLFTRFYKTENEAAGTGLGLAIVKAICDLYGFEISYSFDNQLHRFKISFASH